MTNMNDCWYTPEEKVPPLHIAVWMEIIVGYNHHMHIYGWYDLDGWHTLRDDIKEYRVAKWRCFGDGTGCAKDEH